MSVGDIVGATRLSSRRADCRPAEYAPLQLKQAKQASQHAENNLAQEMRAHIGKCMIAQHECAKQFV